MSTTSTSLAELAATHAAASRIFASHGLDFCCGGERSLEAACRQAGLDPAAILAAVTSDPAPAARDWSVAPRAALIDHILETCHAPLKAELPRLEGLAAKVAERHAGRAPEGLLPFLQSFAEGLLSHMAKEERVLFPMLRAGRAAAPPIAVMRAEHDAHGEALAALRALTDGYRAPADACPTWRALYLGLESLERELMEHVHLENNILFRRPADAA